MTPEAKFTEKDLSDPKSEVHEMAAQLYRAEDELFWSRSQELVGSLRKLVQAMEAILSSPKSPALASREPFLELDAQVARLSVDFAQAELRWLVSINARVAK